MHRGNRDRDRNQDRDREYSFKQTHSGRNRFPGSEWGSSSEYGRNSDFHDDREFERYRKEDRFHDRPFDMDNYYSGRQFSIGGVEFERDEDTDFGNREYNRSRFAEPYTGGQFSRSQYGTGGQYDRDRSDNLSRGYGERDRGYSGKGPKGYRRSDDRIREDVCEALFRSPRVDASDIEVIVKEGNVTLRGTVESRNAKREAESCIENLSGVEDVQNELRLRRDEVDSGLTRKSDAGSELNKNRPSH